MRRITTYTRNVTTIDITVYQCSKNVRNRERVVPKVYLQITVSLPALEH